MIQRLSNSWELAKASGRVLRADKELLVFPTISSVAAVIVAACFILPAKASGDLVLGQGAIPYLVWFAFYLCQYVVIFYFNTALVGAALVRLQGGDPTLRDGFRVANGHFVNIVGYAAIAATVGMVLRLVAERAGPFGRIVGRIGGVGWTLATFLVVPVLVAEGLGPVDAIGRSASLLRRTWGEQIAGTVGFGAVFFLAFLATILLGVVAIVAAAATGLAPLIAAVGMLFVLALIALGLAQGALMGIYAAALYRHALGDDASRFFPPELLERAFTR